MIVSNNRKNVLIGVFVFAFLMIAVLIAMAAGGISRASDLRKSQELVERTNDVLHEIDEMQDSLQDAREAALHYVLTPEMQDLVNFDAAVAQSWTRLDRVAQLTKNDKGYPERLEQLRTAMKSELRQLSDYMRTTHTLLIFHSPDADANTNRVRVAMQKFKEDEEEILRVRNEAAHASSREVASSSSLLMIGMIGFTVLMVVLFLLVILGTIKSIAKETAPMAAAAVGDVK
jgi:CHASE3 domain sensor protein